jgi:hypothetical protein
MNVDRKEGRREGRKEAPGVRRFQRKTDGGGPHQSYIPTRT